MKTVSSLAVLAVMAASAAAQGPMINTPEGVIVCQPLLLTWSGGTPPYFLSILPGGQPSAAPLEQFTDLQTTSFTWKVDQPAGTSLGLTIRDSTGASGQSAPFDVHSGPDTSCLNGGANSSSAGGSSTAAGSSSAPSTTSAVSGSASSSAVVTTSVSSSAAGSSSATSPVSTPASSNRPSSTSGTSSAPSSSNTASGGASNNGAQSIVAPLSFTGFLGALVAAVLA